VRLITLCGPLLDVVHGRRFAVRGRRGVAPGLFWTLPLDDNALQVSDDGRRAALEVEDIQVIESYRLFGPNTTPATLSFHIE